MKSETPLLSPCPLNLSLKPQALHAREDFPDIKFWTRSEWMASKDAVISSDHSAVRGRARSAKGDNVAMGFIEDINGEPINGHKAADIRKAIRESWAEMVQAGVAPPTWSRVSHTVLNNFRQRLYGEFAELAYCDGHWKLDKICTDNYSQWYRTHSSDKNLRESTSTTKRPSLEPELLPPSKKPKSGPQSKTTIQGKHV